MPQTTQTAQTTRPTPIRVVFVAFEGMSLLDLSGPLEVFRSVALHPEYGGAKMPYETHVVSANGGPVTTFDGLTMMTAPLKSLNNRTIDTLIVPGGPYAREIMADKKLAHVPALGNAERSSDSLSTT